MVVPRSIKIARKVRQASPGPEKNHPFEKRVGGIAREKNLLGRTRPMLYERCVVPDKGAGGDRDSQTFETKKKKIRNAWSIDMTHGKKEHKS